MKSANEDRAASPAPSLSSSFKTSSYAEVMDITPTLCSDTSYTVDLKRDWCIGQGAFLPIIC